MSSHLRQSAGRFEHRCGSQQTIHDARLPGIASREVDEQLSTEIFKRYQRSELAFVGAPMARVGQRVSTPTLMVIAEKLRSASSSESTPSTLCTSWMRGSGRATSDGWRANVLVDASLTAYILIEDLRLLLARGRQPYARECRTTRRLASRDNFAEEDR